jgi:ferritin-like metal-binding protein YciE
MESGEPGALQDAMLITAAQKVEHYEIATYGTVRTYAQMEATVTNVKRMIPRAQAADRGAARATKSKRSRKR